MDKRSIANFLFEASNLSQTPRSFHGLLGTGRQSVAEHLNRMCYIAYVLARLDGTVDTDKVLLMTLFHDFSESRISDLNYVHQKYVTRDEEKAEHDFAKQLPFGSEIESLLDEYKKKESRESLLVKDADTLDFILSLKEQMDIGNTRAEEWLIPAKKRMKTEIGKEVMEAILTTKSDAWWFDPDDEWFVTRGGKDE